jgi:hypothetical protein
MKLLLSVRTMHWLRSSNVEDYKNTDLPRGQLPQRTAAKAKDHNGSQIKATNRVYRSSCATRRARRNFVPPSPPWVQGGGGN